MRQNTSITNWMKMIPDFQTLILLFYFEFIILANGGKLNVFYLQFTMSFNLRITFQSSSLSGLPFMREETYPF